MGGEIDKGAAAVNTSDVGAAIEEPTQHWIQTGGVKDSRGAEKRQVTGQLRRGTRDEEGVGQSGTAEQSGQKRCRLDDGRSDWEQVGVSAESKRDGAELICEGEPSNSAVQQEEVAAGGGVGGGRETGISNGEGGRGTETRRWVGGNGTERV